MKRRLSIEWLVFVACSITGVFVKPLIDPPMDLSGLLLGLPLYLVVGVVRLTVGAIRHLSAR
jgi:hypothetical protein